MSETDDALPPGQIRFLDNYEPGLKAGTYTITVKHTLGAPNASVPDLPQRVVVAGPRFAIDPADIHTQFPPNGASSQFAEVLPHVVLNKRLLPWERDIPKLSDNVPWLALLVFDDDELVVPANTDPSTVTVANYAQTMTVDQLTSTPSSAAYVPQFVAGTVTADEQKISCNVITIRSEIFAAIVPTANELPYLAHAREVDTNSKKLLDLQNSGLFSVVVANRFPVPGDATRGAKSIVHLVSLEGFGDLLGGAAPVKPTQPHVKLVSLYSWTFSCLADPQQKFSGLAQNLAYDAAGLLRPAASLALHLPFTPSQASGAAAAEQRLADGYVALGYHAPTGEDGYAWYRGPFVPVVPNTVPKDGPFQTASSAVIFDPKSCAFDQSLAAAWQIGRALALADQAFSTTLMRLRARASTQLNLMAFQENTTPISPSRMVQTQLAELFAGGALTKIQQISNAALVRPPARAPRAPAPQPPVQRLRTALAQTSVKAALMGQLADDPDMAAVTQWLGLLQLLNGVPFVHLVPDARILPQESIRFFYLDPNWIGALTDGAVSVGLGSSQQAALQGALTAQIEQKAAASALADRAESLDQPVPAAAQGPMSGFLIRSALVSGWPGLSVTGTQGGADVPLLRLDHLAPDVLLCLFNGVPDTVTLAEPHEGLEFGVGDQGEIMARTVSPPHVTEVAAITIYNPQDPTVAMVTLRTGGMRVLNVNASADPLGTKVPDMANDLLSLIAKTLNTGPAAIGPAMFAVQMVKGPEELTFSLSPPSKPQL